MGLSQEEAGLSRMRGSDLLFYLPRHVRAREEISNQHGDIGSSQIHRVLPLQQYPNSSGAFV